MLEWHNCITYKIKCVLIQSVLCVCPIVTMCACACACVYVCVWCVCVCVCVCTSWLTQEVDLDPDEYVSHLCVELW